VHKREAWWTAVINSKFGSSWGGWYSYEPLGWGGMEEYQEVLGVVFKSHQI